MPTFENPRLKSAIHSLQVRKVPCVETSWAHEILYPYIDRGMDGPTKKLWISPAINDDTGLLLRD